MALERCSTVPLPPFQMEELKQQLEVQEEELGRLRLGVVRPLGTGAEGVRGPRFQVSPEASFPARGRQTQKRGFSV